MSVADTDFPSTLPGVLLATYSNEEVERWRANSIVTGPLLYELLSEDTPMFATVTWNFSLFELQMFEAWWSASLLYGARAFNIDLPVGKGNVEHECNFAERYTVSRNGKRVIVNARLVATEKIYDDPADACDILLLGSMTCDSDKCGFFNAFITFGEDQLPDAWETINYGTDYS